RPGRGGRALRALRPRPGRSSRGPGRAPPARAARAGHPPAGPRAPEAPPRAPRGLRGASRGAEAAPHARVPGEPLPARPGAGAVSVILGTAGHIDHGKTALVRALTGIDTDRLKEERERGITIELGFAELRREGLPRFGVVDVPGHEAFVRAMLAGAAGMDVVLLVVAADEGVMPQTREHLAIVRLLGVPELVVAYTKCDLVEPDWLELVEADVDELLEGGPYRAAPRVRTSAVRGDGLDELVARLVEAAARV